MILVQRVICDLLVEETVEFLGCVKKNSEKEFGTDLVQVGLCVVSMSNELLYHSHKV